MRRSLCILAVAAACGPSSYHDFRDQLTTRWCARQIRCGEVGAGESQHCGLPTPLLLTMRGDVDVTTAIGQHRMTFHPDNASECLDAVKSAPCDPRQAADDFYRHCHGVVTGAVDNGHACRGDDECLGGICVGAACGSGTCTPYASDGAACVAMGGSPAETCDPTVMFCNVGAGVCMKKVKKGDPCTDDSQCLFDGVCVAERCADPPRVKRDASCGDGLPPCEDGLYCNEAGACAPLLDASQSCARPDACKPGLACIAGACAAWLDAGGACMSGSASAASGCPSTQTCTAGACVVMPGLQLAPLAKCASDGDCATGLYCTTTGYCYYQSGVGAGCQADHECAHGLVCSGSSCARPLNPSGCAPPAN